MADSYIGTLVYRITGQTDGLKKSLSESKSSAEGFGGFMSGWAGKLVGVIGAAFTIGKIVEFDKKLLEVASHSNEVASRFANTFPNAIGKANASVAELTESYGYSSTAAKESMSATGGLLATLGMSEDQTADTSAQVAKLGADLASYTDFAGGAKGASDALTKALLGETESSKSLSLSIGDDALANYAAGLGKSVSAMSAAEKAQLRLNLAFSQASAMGAVGDMIKTAHGYANTLRSVQGKIEDAEARAGQALIPNVTKLTEEFGRAVSPGGAFAGMLDTVAEAGAQTTGILSVLLSKLNEASRASAAVNGKKELELNRLMLSGVNAQIEAEGGLAKVRAKSGSSAEAAQMVASYDRYTARIGELGKELEGYDKQDQEARRQQTLESAQMYQERMADAERNAARAKAKLNEISDAESKGVDVSGLSLGREAAQKEYDRNMSDWKLYAGKFGAMLQRDGVSLKEAYDQATPTTKKHIAAASSPVAPTDTIKKAQEAKTAILAMDAASVQLAEDTSKLSSTGLAYANKELEKAPPLAGDFVKAFGAIGSSYDEFINDLKTKPLDQVMAKWKDELNKAGDAASGMNKSKEIKIPVKIAVDKAAKVDFGPLADIKMENLFPSDADWKTNIDKVQKYQAAWQEVSMVAGDVGNSLNGLLQGAGAAMDAYTKAQLASLDGEMKRAEEAAGVADSTAVQSAELALAKAKKKGDAETILEAQKALKKAKIEEEFAKKKSKIEYEGAVNAWDIQVAQGAIAIPLAGLNTFAALSKYGPIVAGLGAAAAVVSAGLMEGAVIESKPKKGSYAFGGVVPGSSYTGDRIEANVNSGEMILNARQQKTLWNAANGQGAKEGGVPCSIVVNLDSTAILSAVSNASFDGQIIISPKAIAAR